MFTLDEFKKHIRPTLKLAAPLAIAQLGQMLMSLVDTFMVGKLGPQFIAAVGLGNSIFWICGLPCIGLLAGLDYLVSYNFGQRNLPRCHYWLTQGIYFGLFVSVPSALLIFLLAHNLSIFGFDAELVFHAQNFLSTFCWNIIPFALFMAFRQYVQSRSHVRFITIVTLLGNVTNAFFNWIFIYGHGVDPMGVAGSGVATFLTRLLMLIAVVIYTYRLDRKAHLLWKNLPWNFDMKGLRELMRLGVPAAAQMSLEVGVFSLSTILAGRVNVTALASHSIVLNIASFTFMVPLGVSAAAAILVGQAEGRHNREEARNAGWSSFIFGVGFMACSAIFLYVLGDSVLSLFTHDDAVISLGKKLLLLAAFFQVADGTQVVGTGALRGLGETKLPMYANLIGHWCIGLPIGATLCFYFGYGIRGLWLGLTTGLISVAIAVLFSWKKRISVTPA